LQIPLLVAVLVTVDVAVLVKLVVVVIVLVADDVAVVVNTHESQRTGQFSSRFARTIGLGLSQSAALDRLQASGSTSPWHVGVVVVKVAEVLESVVEETVAVVDVPVPDVDVAVAVVDD
jgi:hypothetical protein